MTSKFTACAGFAQSPAQVMLSLMLSDEDLMLQYQAGDANAFDTLYDKYRGDVYRFLSRQLEPAIAEELYQDIWIKLIQAKHRYKPSASFRTYLYTITHNRLRDYWRKQGDNQQPSGEALDDCRLTDPLDPETINQDQQAVTALLEGIQLLPNEQQQAFLLKVESGLSVDEIANVMQASRESTRSRLRYAMNKLREHLRGIWP